VKFAVYGTSLTPLFILTDIQWPRLVMGWALTFFYISVTRGCCRAWVELVSVFNDIKHCLHYICTGGDWSIIGVSDTERLQNSGNNKFGQGTRLLYLLNGAQFVSVFTGYMYSYGLLSDTVFNPVYNMFRTLTIIDFTDAIDRELLFDVLCKAYFVALYHCLAANLSSHRYFSHRSFKTSRTFQAILAVIAGSSGQRGALWWASKHRQHHRCCGHMKDDPHNPKARGSGVTGFLYAHIGWFTDRQHFSINLDEVADWWQNAPELLFIEILYPAIFAAGIYWREHAFGTTATLLGFAFSIHFEGLINSYCHKTEYDNCGACDSLLVSCLTGGEGFHNGHHADPLCANHAWQWGPFLCYLDLNYVIICALNQLGVIWAVRVHGNCQPQNLKT